MTSAVARAVLMSALRRMACAIAAARRSAGTVKRRKMRRSMNRIGGYGRRRNSVPLWIVLLLFAALFLVMSLYRPPDRGPRG